jgi:putative peptidoglycan lipid II flippase
VTEPAAPVTTGSAEPGAQPRRASAGIGRAAALIAALTVAARLAGLGRQLVFAHTVEAHCLGAAYVTANQVPNIIYDIILGGALASVMVPVLARPAQRAAADPAAARQVERTASALLTWTVLILAPVSAVIAVAAGPIARLLTPANPGAGCGHADLIAVSGRMLAVFAPQVLCYGLAVALYGILQAYRKFTAPALAPVLSSLVVIAAYAAFVPLGGAHRTRLGGLPPGAALELSAGTTLGVAALAITALVPVLRLRLRLRPALRFPAGAGRRARRLAVYGVAALACQDISALVVIALANGHGAQGALVLYGYGFQVFTAVYAVLAIPVAISAFPVLSAARGQAEFDETAAGSVRAVLLLSCLGAALLAAVAAPAARLFSSGGQSAELALSLTAFAPGLIGYGVAACLSRVLLAAGRSALAGVAVCGGWLIVVGADVTLVHLAPARWVVAALGLGNTIGLTVGGAALAAAVRRVRGRAALRATARAAAVGILAAAAGATVGAGAAALVPRAGTALAIAAAVLAAVGAAAVFAAVAFLLDAGDLRATVSSFRRTANRWLATR